MPNPNPFTSPEHLSVLAQSIKRSVLALQGLINNSVNLSKEDLAEYQNEVEKLRDWYNLINEQRSSLQQTEIKNDTQFLQQVFSTLTQLQGLTNA